MNPSCPRHSRGRSLPRRAFTIIEVMIAMAIFMMVVAAIYATWSAVLRATKAGLQAAANVQRGRIALRTLQDALLTAVNYPDNVKYYTFVAETSGDFADVEFSARLPSSFPGVGRYGGSLLRRVRFTVEQGKDNKGNELVMYEKPFLLPPDNDFNPYRLVLSHDVSLFMVEFFDAQKREYTREWSQTNALPKLVRIAVGLGKQSSGNAPQDLVTTSVAIPATAIARVAPRIQ
ncbi:MAG TPA: hypothetical protein DCM86_06210 [Verrucomicrobiales bacterium]|nr:hypothetical protein [Verrucomicrobiales bacterium]